MKLCKMAFNEKIDRFCPIISDFDCTKLFEIPKFTSEMAILINKFEKN